MKKKKKEKDSSCRSWLMFHLSWIIWFMCSLALLLLPLSVILSCQEDFNKQLQVNNFPFITTLPSEGAEKQML